MNCKSVTGLLFCLLLCCGCSKALLTASSSPATTSNDQASRPLPDMPSTASFTQPDPKRLQEVIAELERLGATDIAAQQRLLADLRGSDPVIWPLVVEQFQATQAFRARTGSAQSSSVAARATAIPTESTLEPPQNAACELAQQVGPLFLNNLAFCTEVAGYGSFKRVEKNEFSPNQEVLLYLELENFVSEPTVKGFHTAIKSGYQIFDAEGKMLLEQFFPKAEEYCQSRRRDFFVAFKLRMPKNIAHGHYTLRLNIEDLVGRKQGWAAIDFSIKPKNDT